MPETTPNNPTNETNAPDAKEINHPETRGRLFVDSLRLVPQFLSECCEFWHRQTHGDLSEDFMVPVVQLYLAYVVYCGKHDVVPLCEDRFIAQCRRLVGIWKVCRKPPYCVVVELVNKHRIRVAPGLRLRNPRWPAEQQGPGNSVSKQSGWSLLDSLYSGHGGGVSMAGACEVAS